MIISFLKKYSALCSALSLLLAIAAAPYLIPSNPDSMIFRSGTMGMLLISMYFIPH